MERTLSILTHNLDLLDLVIAKKEFRRPFESLVIFSQAEPAIIKARQRLCPRILWGSAQSCVLFVNAQLVASLAAFDLLR